MCDSLKQTYSASTVKGNSSLKYPGKPSAGTSAAMAWSRGLILPHTKFQETYF